MEHIKHCNPQVASAKRANNSFTLIELLVVIAIIAILAAVIITSTGSARQQARDARRTQDLDALATALEVYYSDHKAYPTGNIGPGSSSSDQGFCIEKATGTGKFQNLLTQGNYLSTIPKDPLYQDVSDPDYCYWYQTKDNGQKFKLFAKAEKDNFEPAQKDGGLYANYYESYSINSGSNQIAFTGGGSGGGGSFGSLLPCGYYSVQDAEGNVYPTVQIGTQCWLKENMNIGTMIQGTSNQGTNCSSAASIQKYCYGNNSTNCDTYGGLYQWDQAMCGTTTSLKGICPTGWHIPTDAEYKTLEINLGCSTAEVDNTGWRCDGVGTQLKPDDGSGFEGLLAGYRDTDSSFYYLSSYGYFWSSTESSASSACWRKLYSGNSTVGRSTDNKAFGFSVRCLKD